MERFISFDKTFIDKMLAALLQKVSRILSDEAAKDRGCALDEKLRELSLDDVFRKFEDRIKSQFAIEYDETKYPSFFDYVSSLFMVDMVDEAFMRERIVLPSHLDVLDVGAGPWTYVHSLYDFLSNYGGQRDIHLVGIDIKGKKCQEHVGRLINQLPAEFLPGDIFKLYQKESYDLVFMAHMVASQEAFRRWGIRYRPHSQLFSKLFEMLKPEGLFVGTAYLHAGEAAIFNHFPPEKKILDWDYRINVGRMSEFLSNYHTFYNNAIVLGRK